MLFCLYDVAQSRLYKTSPTVIRSCYHRCTGGVGNWNLQNVLLC